ncbi:hypothetical protein J2S16_004097 [Cytobacillus kochii]|nr:hypothetical protein [Cytobacillus kochii]
MRLLLEQILASSNAGMNLVIGGIMCTLFL